MPTGSERKACDCIDCVGGPLRKGATGLSLFFPLDSANRLDNYASCNPFERYSDYLFTFYADRENEVISFLSYATPGGENDNYMTFVLFFATLIFSYDSRTNKTDIVGIMYEGDPGQIHELTPGTEIAVCKRKVLEDGSRRDIDSELFVYTEDMAVEIGKVPDGFYQYNTYVKDIYGKQYCAGAALILMQDGNSILVATSPDDIFFRDIESSPEL